MNESNDAEEILCRIESKARPFKLAFLCSLVGLSTLVAANAKWGVPDVITAKSMNVVDSGGVVGVVGAQNNKVVVATAKADANLISLGEDSTGAGTIVLGSATAKNVMRLSVTKGAGGSVGVNGPSGIEIANASPNTANAGSLFIDNAAGALIGELNGDKVNGGAIIVHDAQGKEIARVHQ